MKFHMWVQENGLSAISHTILVDRPEQLVVKVETSTIDVVIKSPLRRAEVTANERLAAAGIPVPRILAQHDDYLMMEWIAGEALSSASPNPAQLEAGRILRRVHQLGGGPPWAGNTDYADWMAGWLNHCLAWWQPGPSRAREIWARFRQLEPLLETRGHDLILFDGRPDHFIVREGTIASVIDLSELRSGDGAMDVAVMAVSDPLLLPGVLAGYGPPTPDRELLDFYLLLRRLSHAEWNLTHGLPAAAGHILRLVQEDSR